jgi:hypothetical protein
MYVSNLSTNLLVNTAISALKNAYEECGDKTARESIFTASRAILQLHHDPVKLYDHDKLSENDSDFDPSEYCAAV